MARRTKIVATVGPASSDERALSAMLAAGVDVVRLNLSHGDVEDHLAVLRRVRSLSASLGRQVAVLADLPGPKIRAGAFSDGGVVLTTGSAVRLVVGDGPSTDARITVDYPTLLHDVSEGERIVIGDGAIDLRVVRIEGDEVHGLVETGGAVQGRPGVHLPSESSRLTAPTADDLALARRMVDAGVDFIALSFVRSRDDVDRLRAAVAPRQIAVVAKLETSAALARLDEIIDASDAVMVARGDLGIECPLEDVPHLQKRIIRASVVRGVPVITATQMLESMTKSPSPTRAEVADVANAVLDGTDALMLSGETAIGVDPARVVQTMARIAERAESSAVASGAWSALRDNISAVSTTGLGADLVTRAVTAAAWQASRELGADAVLCATRSGRTARAMARFRPDVRLIAFTSNDETARSLALVWGLEQLSVPPATSSDELVAMVVDRALDAGVARRGHPVIVVAGAPDRPSRGATDVLRIVTPS